MTRLTFYQTILDPFQEWGVDKTRFFLFERCWCKMGLGTYKNIKKCGSDFLQSFFSFVQAQWRLDFCLSGRVIAKDSNCGKKDAQKICVWKKVRPESSKIKGQKSEAGNQISKIIRA